MSIKKTKDNTYRIEAYIGIDNKGKKIRKYATIKGTKKEAQIAEAELISKYKKQPLIKGADSNITFSTLSDIFMDNKKSMLAVTTYSGYVDLLKVINLHIGNVKINNLNPLILEKFYNDLRERENQRKLSENTILHYYTLINAIFTKAKRWGIVSHNPNEAIDRPIIDKKPAKFYNEEETKILANQLKKEPLKFQALFLLAIDSGARVGEILALDWDDINFKTGIINITKVVHDSKEGMQLKTKPKNNSSVRSIPITEETLRVINLYKLEEEKHQTLCSKIFHSEKGGYMHISTPNKTLKKIAKSCGIPINNFHSLRHTSASLQIAFGIHTKIISTRLGHSSITTTDKIYTHVSTLMQNEVTYKMNNLLS